MVRIVVVVVVVVVLVVVAAGLGALCSFTLTVFFWPDQLEPFSTALKVGSAAFGVNALAGKFFGCRCGG